MNLFKYILLLTILTSPIFPKLDSKDSVISTDKLIEIASGIKKTNPKRSLELSELAISRLKENNDERILKAYYNIVENYSYQSRFYKVIEYSLKGYYSSKDLESDNYEIFFLNKIGNSYLILGDYDNATQYYLNANSTLQNNPDSDYLPIVLRNLILLYHSKGNEDSAKRFEQELQEYYRSHKEASKFSEVYSMLSYHYLSQRNYKKALHFALLELETYKENDDELIDEFYGRLASIYSKSGNPDYALKYYFKALSIATEKNDHFAIARYQTNIGSAYVDKTELDSALFFYENALTITKSKIDSENLQESLKFKRRLSLIYNNLAVIYLEKENFIEALGYGLNAINVEEELDRSHEVLPYITVIEIYIKLEQLENASKFVNKILTDDYELSYEQKLRVFKLSSELEEKKGNFNKSLAIYKNYMGLKDSINKANSEQALQKLQVEYNTEILEKQTEIKEKENKYTIITSIIVLTAVLAIALLLYFKFKEKKKAESELSEKNELITKNHKELEKLYQDLQSQERKLYELNNSKDKFFSIIAHDLKNPLHNLFLSSEIVYTYFERYTKEQLVNNLKSMNESAKAASNLLQNLLTWARAQSGSIEFNPIEINIFYLIGETIELLTVTANNKNIKLINEIDEEIFVYADANMIETVFRNLISNSLKFTPAEGSIKIKYYNEIHFWKFAIIDTGTGIKAEDLNKLFRIDVHHTTKGTEGEGGTGLGLILCKEFIEKNGGEISVESEYGKGTVFYFTLPKAYPVEKESKQKQLS